MANTATMSTRASLASNTNPNRTLWGQVGGQLLPCSQRTAVKRTVCRLSRDCGTEIVSRLPEQNRLVCPQVIPDCVWIRIEHRPVCRVKRSLQDTTVTDNRVSATTAAASATANATSGGIGVCVPGKATIFNTAITANIVDASAPAGVAVAEGGGIQTGVSVISNSLVSGNRLTASTKTGSAVVHGAGVQHGNGTLQVSGTTISGNTGTATGPSGEALGGGIWNDVFFPGPPSPRLTLVDTTVTNNTLSASPGIAVHGGGLFTTFPVSLTNSAVSGNTPDDCFGISC